MPYNPRNVPAEVHIGRYHCRYWAGALVDGCIRSKVSTSVSKRCDVMADSRAGFPAVLQNSRMCKELLGSIAVRRTEVYNAGTWLVKVVFPLRVGYSGIPQLRDLTYVPSESPRSRLELRTTREEPPVTRFHMRVHALQDRPNQATHDHADMM
jgi:hypothetical protein